MNTKLPNPAALREYTAVFHRLGEFSSVTTFRDLSSTGQAAGADEVLRQCIVDANQIISEEQFFTNRDEFLQTVGGAEGFGNMMAKHKTEIHSTAVDSASMIFSHSILDDVVYRLLKCSLLAQPKDWERHTDSKTASLAEYKDQTYSDIQLSKAQNYLNSLERASLLAKSDALFALCSPPEKFVPMNDYVFDRERLKHLDELRHQVVHGDGHVEFKDINDELWYMQKTGFFYFALINEKYDLKFLTPDQLNDIEGA
jgi:hypothetical protein